MSTTASASSRFVRIFDTTLRDGEQTPGVALTPDQKVQIARALDALGVDTIEAGFPIVSEGEQESFRRILGESLRAEICALARAAQADIDSALRLDVPCVHVFIATSDVHLQHKLHMTREQVYERAVEMVRYAKGHGVTVEFSAEDATRTDLPYLLHVYRGVVEAGADRLNIPDTVGTSTPERMGSLVQAVRSACNIPVSVHCHDDFGLAVANSIAGVEAGATQVHATINGLGERAGNASLEEVVVALSRLYCYATRVRTERLFETSRLVSQLTRVIVQPNKAIVGDNAFGHEAGIHTHGILAEPRTYEAMEPEFVGQRRWLQAGKHAGTHGLAHQLRGMGLSPSDAEIDTILHEVKNLGDRGHSVTDADLLRIAAEHTNQAVLLDRLLELEDLAVITGIHTTPTASLKLRVNGADRVVAETGVGPVDAAIRAILKGSATISDVRLAEYHLDAISGGSEATAEAYVKVEDPTGLSASARARGPDVVVASVDAMIAGVNILLRKRRAQDKVADTAEHIRPIQRSRMA